MEKEIIRYENPDLPITLHKLNMRQGATYRGMHSHVAVEVIEVKSGVLNCNVCDEVIEVYPNQIVFINSNTGHRLFSDNAEICYMQIDTAALRENASDGSSMLCEFVLHTKAKPYMTFSDNEEVREILRKIKAKYCEDEQSGGWYLRAYLYELIAFMYAQSFIIPAAIHAKQFLKIRAVTEYIDANFKLPLTLDDICAAVKCDRFALCHTFKAVTGSTIFEYINFLRVHYAVNKLRQNSGSFLEIAIDSGFSSAAYFNRVFKRIIGSSPSVYRKFLTER